MARLIVYEGFIEARSKVWSERLGKNIDEMLRTIELMPGVGSSIVPDCTYCKIGRSFGWLYGDCAHARRPSR